MKHTIIFLIPLLLLFSQVAYATNESSYKYGFHGGKSEYQSCMTPDADCTGGGDYCSDPIMGTIPVFVHNEHAYEAVNLGHVSNMTACLHGFIHGWNHVCDPVKAKKAKNPQGCPTNFYNELDINTVATYDDGVQHLYISHYEHVKPSKHNLADVIQSHLLNSTWNIVNATNMDAMSMDNIGNMNTNAVSGTITFSSSTIGEGVYTENIKGHIIQGVWNVGNVVGIPGVDLCPMASNICETLHYKTGDFTNHIKFTDEHGSTIHLMK